MPALVSNHYRDLSLLKASRSPYHVPLPIQPAEDIPSSVSFTSLILNLWYLPKHNEGLLECPSKSQLFLTKGLHFRSTEGFPKPEYGEDLLPRFRSPPGPRILPRVGVEPTIPTLTLEVARAHLSYL